MALHPSDDTDARQGQSECLSARLAASVLQDVPLCTTQSAQHTQNGLGSLTKLAPTSDRKVSVFSRSVSIQVLTHLYEERPVWLQGYRQLLGHWAMKTTMEVQTSIEAEVLYYL